MSAAPFSVRLNRRDKPDKTTKNGIQIVEKHRNELPADTALHARLPRTVRRGGRVQRREELPVRPAPAREDLCARSGQVADAGPLARPQPEPARRGAGARPPLPRALLHAGARPGGHREQHQPRPVPMRQERLPLLAGSSGEGLLQPRGGGQHQSAGAGRFGAATSIPIRTA